MPEPLSRLYGFAVVPKHQPGGGEVAIDPVLEETLDQVYHRAAQASGRTVHLLADGNEVRDALISIAFHDDIPAAASARLLAERLATAMDRRSPPGLFVLSVHGSGATREVEMWLFPRSEAFRYRSDRIELADDIFSISSKVRKAAMFRGSNQPGEFLIGRVVDYQAHGSDRYVAGFWVERFLQARLEMSGEEGTLLFAKTVKMAFDALRDDAAAQRELAGAVDSVRGGARRLSVNSFAEEHLSGAAADTLVASAPSVDAAAVSFQFDPRSFDEAAGYRVFRLDSGVVVTAPAEIVGDSEAVVESDGMLQVQGVVASQTLRSRRGFTARRR